MLQGPGSPFFRQLAAELVTQGVAVRKINLNLGDTRFFPRPNAVYFRDRFENWSEFLIAQLDRENIDSIALFGETRPYHHRAIEIASSRGIPIFVFEEGYVRPDYVTIEIGGVNGKSRLMDQPLAHIRCQNYENGKSPARIAARPVGNTFYAMMLKSIQYWILVDFGKVFFPHYKHHKPTSFSEFRPWIVSAYRKLKHAAVDRSVVERLLKNDRPYFLVPLQVHRDSQIIRDSPYPSVGHFIHEILQSFAEHAPADHYLLFKHHPLDRGHTDYTALLKSVSEKLGCQTRVSYARDAHLPTLLKHACGTVTINSTVGLSSLVHETPVKPMGRAIYDRPGLTPECSLNNFWNNPGKVDPDLVEIFMNELVDACQVNGNFYRTRVIEDFVPQVVRCMARLFAESGEFHLDCDKSV